VHVAVKLEQATAAIRDVWFGGDLPVHPRRIVRDLEAVLRDVTVADVDRHVERFFASRPADLGGLQPGDFASAVRLAAGQRLAA
jgi:hypothetical protein